MKNAIQWLRSLVFIIQMYVMLFVIGIGLLPLPLFNRKYVHTVMRAYANWVCWSALAPECNYWAWP